jgi:hypothetical protein
MSLRLRILQGDATIAAQGETAPGRRPGECQLTETGLPLDFDQDFHVILLAVVVARVAPATLDRALPRRPAGAGA